MQEIVEIRQSMARIKDLIKQIERTIKVQNKPNPKGAGRKPRDNYVVESKPANKRKVCKTGSKAFKIVSLGNGKRTVEEIASMCSTTATHVLQTFRAVARKQGYGFRVSNGKIRVLDGFKKDCVTAEKPKTQKSKTTRRPVTASDLLS